MTIYRLKKINTFSLITIVIIMCCLISNLITNFSFSPYNKIMEKIKKYEMNYVFGEQYPFSGNYSNNTKSNDLQNAIYNYERLKGIENSFELDNYYNNYINNNFILLNEQKDTQEAILSDQLTAIQYTKISSELKKQINEDSYRNQKLGFYYVFDFENTMNVLNELEPVIEGISEAQMIPKALIKAVLFREMMFMGQEDLLDGMPVIGGKSIGICQIGLQNVRYNEECVHGKNSKIAAKADKDIKAMLQIPEQAVYFCAMQIKARAIKLTKDKNVDLNVLSKEKIMNILAEYNQSGIKKTIGPVKTKEKYAEETYRYYDMFTKLYD